MNKAQMILEAIEAHIKIDQNLKGVYIKGIEAGLAKIEPIIIKEDRRRRVIKMHEQFNAIRAMNNESEAGGNLQLTV